MTADLDRPGRRTPEVPATVLPGSRDAKDPARALTPTGQNYTREEVAAIQRGRLVDAIVQVSAESGYPAAGIKAVSTRAGVSVATFYEHFKSKEDLFLAAYDAGVAALFDAVGEAYAASENLTWQQRVDAGLGTLLHTLAENPAFARFFLVVIHSAGAAAQQRVEEALEAANGMFADVEPNGPRDLPLSELVPLLVGGIYTRLASYVRAGRTAELPNLLPVFTRFSLSVLGSTRAETINLQPPR